MFFKLKLGICTNVNILVVNVNCHILPAKLKNEVIWTDQGWVISNSYSGGGGNIFYTLNVSLFIFKPIKAKAKRGARLLNQVKLTWR